MLLAVTLLLAWRAEDFRQLQPHLGAERAPPAPPDLPRLAVGLQKIASGFNQITDLQAVPDPLPEPWLVVVEKTGQAHLLDRQTYKRVNVLSVVVATRSEEGLLGWAFDPSFAGNRLFYTNAVVEEEGKDRTSIDAWRFPDIPADGSLPSGKATFVRRVLAFDQPYPNHNGGQLAFGKDGMLYVGTGDGGSAGDPHGNGQNPASWLGKMLRIDVRSPAAGQGYAVPADNPFVGQTSHLPEIWALGLRNPWRFSFDQRGRLWVADVGQNRLEEIDLVQRGANLGWNKKEGRDCFEPASGCEVGGLTEPFWQGAHPDHVSVTGGFVYEGRAIPSLAGKYVFGDFIVRRLWAADAPPDDQPAQAGPVWWLADHDLMVSTFGRERDGELLVGDFGGTIWRIVPELEQGRQAEPSAAR